MTDLTSESPQRRVQYAVLGAVARGFAGQYVPGIRQVRVLFADTGISVLVYVIEITDDLLEHIEEEGMDYVGDYAGNSTDLDLDLEVLEIGSGPVGWLDGEPVFIEFGESDSVRDVSHVVEPTRRITRPVAERYARASAASRLADVVFDTDETRDWYARIGVVATATAGLISPSVRNVLVRYNSPQIEVQLRQLDDSVVRSLGVAARAIEGATGMPVELVFVDVGDRRITGVGQVGEPVYMEHIPYVESGPDANDVDQDARVRVRVESKRRLGPLTLRRYRVQEREAGTGNWMDSGRVSRSRAATVLDKHLHSTDVADMLLWAVEEHNAGGARWTYPLYGPK